MLRTLAVLSLATLAMAQPSHNVAARVAKWKRVDMPLTTGLSTRELQMVDKLVDACRLLDDIFWRQSDRKGLELYKSTPDQALKRLLMIMGSRWDLLDDNHPFAGNEPMPPGHDLYPRDLTRAAVERDVAKHPQDRAAVYSPYTVLKWRNGRLIGVPYHEEYKEFLEPMAKDLRDAAALSGDPAFANFLRLRAEALLTDDYFQSDLAWLDLKNPRFDVIFAPYETYLDDLLAVKTSYGASVLIRNEEESRKLAIYEQYVPDIQDALPLDAADRPSKRGHVTPMEVMDAPYRAGDLRHGYQAVADNLPNDPRIHQQKGSKKIFFKNFMDARVNYIILPVAQRLMTPAQAAKATAEGYMAGTLLHEISHELGPEFARVKGKRVDINEAIGPAYSGLEEAKADVVGMFGLKWLADRGALPKGRLEEYYASYVAGLFRTLRFGAGEAHGRAETMELAWLWENRAVVPNAGRFVVDYGRMPEVIARLARELLTLEAAGDRRRAEAWFANYGKIPPALSAALARTSDIPVDIDPVFSFKDEVR
ncbi:MAG: Zn-dependent hydrolase [Acidobacteriia bacterium]|nr:Zn-dependent hydrolase [Terriglobia bacterium]